MQYKFAPLHTLAAIFGCIEDPRDNRGTHHKLLDIFILAVFGLLWGHTDFTNLALELKYHEAYFTELLGLVNGIPSHDTFSAAFSIIDPAQFLECFIQWIVDLTDPEGKHIALDGKAVRAACEKVYCKKVPVLVNALMVDSGICLGQLKVAAKSNEIRGIPDLLAWLDLEGSVVTTDAIGCQKSSTELIIQKGADFVLPVKDNQPNLHQDIRLELESVIAMQKVEAEAVQKFARKGLTVDHPLSDQLSIHQDYSCKQNQGWMERRTYYVYNDPASILKEEWPHVAALGMVIRERLVIQRQADGQIKEEDATVEVESYIISKKMQAEEFACYSRGKRTESSLHWVLDDVLREDRCTARKTHAIKNIEVMRKIIYNLLKLDPAVAGMSVRAKQVYYRNNPAAVCRLLFEVIPGR